MKGSRLSSVGSALADPGRGEILGALSSGRAHTSGELANWIGLAPSTTSSHLSKLVDAGLVIVEPSGRHRYYRIASEEVADLLERIDSLSLPETNAPERPKPGTELSYARSCYDHLAGELGVQLYAALIDRRYLEEVDMHPLLTDAGASGLAAVGIDADALVGRRPLTRQCLDWTQRRHHLGGSLGAALLSQMLDAGWLKRGRDKRVIKVTDVGRTAFEQHFSMRIA